MGQVLCPVVIGRDQELERLAAARASAGAGHGGVVVVVGEAGVGKSRLVREAVEAARRAGASVVAGRASETSAVPFRPLTEALLAGLRARDLSESSELAPFRPALARLVPQWRSEVAGSGPGEPTPWDDDIVVLSEGVLRLLAALDAGGGTVMVLEDLHWADPETLAVLDYLSDNLFDQAVLVVATVRSDECGAGRDVVDRLVRRRAATLVELRRLDRGAATAIATAALGVDELSAVERSAVDRAEGLPFLIEELLAMTTTRGADPRGVPATVAETVRRRLEMLGPDARAVSAAVAVAGWPLDSAVLRRVVPFDDSQLVRALRDAEAAPLLERAGDSWTFRHSLTRDAVLAELFAHERTELAGSLLRAVQDLHPELEADWCERAAGLAAVAGLRSEAAQRFLESARRSTAAGALTSAESMLDTASKFTSGDLARSSDVDELRAEVLALAGKWDQVFEIGNRLLASLVEIDAPAERRARVHLRLARAANAAGHAALARRHLDDAEHLAGDTRDVVAAVEALRAHVAITDQDLDGAVEHARAAIAMSESARLPAVTCEALEVIGRHARLTDLTVAEAALTRALEIAEAHDLPVWRLRAIHELGIVDMFAHQSTDRMLEARDLAFRSGALTVALDVDLQLAGYCAVQFRPQDCRDAAERAAEGARRLHLEVPLAMAYVQAAGAEAESGNFDAVEPLLADAAAVAGDHPDVLAFSAGHVRAMALLLQERRVAALEQLDVAMDVARRAPSTPPGQWLGVWPLVCAVEDRGGASALDEVRRLGHTTSLNDALYPFTDAVLAGRAGDSTAAARAFRRGDELARQYEGFRMLAHRLVAECAIGDGWGDPVPWLRGALAFFDSRGHTQVADACRALLRQAGAPAPRRRNASAVAPDLQALGVTAREAAVLELVAEGLSNPEIAERLFISPRTAAKHVERLLAKFGVADRRSLRAAAHRRRT